MNIDEPLTDEELASLETHARLLYRAVIEIRGLRRELSAFDGVRRYLRKELVQPVEPEWSGHIGGAGNAAG